MKKTLATLSLLIAAGVSAQTRYSRAPIMPPVGSVLDVPGRNQCTSQLDWFYSNEPGVFQSHPLCNGASTGSSVTAIYGEEFWEQTALHSGSGTIFTVASITSDGEPATQVHNDTTQWTTEPVVPLNKNAGAMAVTVNSSATAPTIQPLAQMVTAANGDYSVVQLQTLYAGGQMCFRFAITASTPTGAAVQSCNYTPGTTHRLAGTWNAANLNLYVDGVSAGSAAYTGSLSDGPFRVVLFPGVTVGGQTTLAKFVIGNLLWSSQDAQNDYQALIPTIPTGGLYVSARQLGTIHSGVMGLAIGALDWSSADHRVALYSALVKMGIKSVRYAGGGDGGIRADYQDWHSNATLLCNPYAKDPTFGSKPYNGMGSVFDDHAARNNTLDSLMQYFVLPLNLDVIYTMNYGTNPPDCNAGGDPAVNAAALATYISTKGWAGYVYKFEAGNEQFNDGPGGPGADLHSDNVYRDNYGSPSSYGAHEPAFYDAIHGVNPSAKVSIMGGGFLGSFWQPTLAQSKWDAQSPHLYPVQGVTDGGLLYPERSFSTVNLTGSVRQLNTIALDHGKDPTDQWVTEWDGLTGGGGGVSAQTFSLAMPLFAVDSLARFMNEGLKYTTFWGQNGDNVPFAPPFGGFTGDTNDTQTYKWVGRLGAGAAVYLGDHVSGVPDPGGHGMKLGDLYPVAHAFELLNASGYVMNGEKTLFPWIDSTNAPWLQAYAATHGAGHYAVILINRDRDNAHTVPVKIAGMSSGAPVQQWTYGRAQFDYTAMGDWSKGVVKIVGSSWSGTYNAVLPPFSANVLVF